MPTAFFVYGTLLQGESNHGVMARHGLVSVRPARVSGRLFDTGCGYPAMLAPQPGQAHWVMGELVGLADTDAALQDLDALEEFFGPGDPRNLYERVEVAVDVGEAGVVRAWTYLYTGSRESLRAIDSGSWRAYRSRGA